MKRQVIQLMMGLLLPCYLLAAPQLKFINGSYWYTFQLHTDADQQAMTTIDGSDAMALVAPSREGSTTTIQLQEMVIAFDRIPLCDCLGGKQTLYLHLIDFFQKVLEQSETNTLTIRWLTNSAEIIASGNQSTVQDRVFYRAERETKPAHKYSQARMRPAEDHKE